MAWALGSSDLATCLQDVNDHAPECEPPFQELAVHTSPGSSTEVTTVSCRVPQEPQRLAFSYSIVGGEARPPGCGRGAGQASHGPLLLPLLSGDGQGRFRLQGAALLHEDLPSGPPPPEQPQTYELWIRVADAGPSTPHLSTTATVIVHLVPPRASTAATSTNGATVRGPGPVRVGEAPGG